MDMEDKDDKNDSLIQQYKVDVENDPKFREWDQLLDLKSPISAEADWYSTRTFEMFLDALDINQPERLQTPVKIKSKGFSTEGNLAKKSDDKRNTTTQSRSDKDHLSCNINANDKNNQRQTDIAETILSAEALQILSELPDLTYMSSTRSFIFPQGNRATSR